MKNLAIETDANTIQADIKTVGYSETQLQGRLVSFVRRMVSGFWAYTEDAGDGDQSSFKGLL